MPEATNSILLMSATRAEALAILNRRIEIFEKAVSVRFGYLGLVSYRGAIAHGGVFLLAACSKVIYADVFVEDITGGGSPSTAFSGRWPAYLAFRLKAGLWVLLVRSVQLWMLAPAAPLVGFLLAGQDYDTIHGWIEFENEACC